MNFTVKLILILRLQMSHIIKMLTLYTVYVYLIISLFKPYAVWEPGPN